MQRILVGADTAQIVAQKTLGIFVLKTLKVLQ